MDDRLPQLCLVCELAQQAPGRLSNSGPAGLKGLPRLRVPSKFCALTRWALWAGLCSTIFGVASTLPLSAVSAEEIGKVDTKFRLLSPDDTVRVEVFDDPSITGIACYLSRAKTGGIKGAVGVAEDTSDASIDCRQIGPIEFRDDIRDGERVFKERRSLIFKQLQVVRFCDATRNTIVYLVYSDRVIEGSPKNSLSAVPLGTGDGEAAPRCADYLK